MNAGMTPTPSEKPACVPRPVTGTEKCPQCEKAIFQDREENVWYHDDGKGAVYVRCKTRLDQCNLYRGWLSGTFCTTHPSESWPHVYQITEPEAPASNAAGGSHKT